MPTADEIQKAMTEGITFRGSGPGTPQKEEFKTKAKKKAYITGSHGSGSAKKKARLWFCQEKGRYTGKKGFTV